MSDESQTVKAVDGQRSAPDGAEHPGSPGASAAPGGASSSEGVAELISELIEDQIDDADEHALSGDVEELVAVAAQRDEYLALAQRTQADFENYRKRVARDSAAAQERGTIALTKELLPALDNLDRALEEEASSHTGDGGPAESLLAGVRLVRAELGSALARARIESFSPIGEPFDPELHEAVATAPQPEGGEPGGTIVEVYQPGYRLGGSIIRPARVVVAA